MNAKKILFIIAVPLVLVPTMGQAEYKLADYDLVGDLDLGAQLSTADHRSGKFDEYRDIRNSVLAGARLSTEKDASYVNLTASRIGLDDQWYRLNFGEYGNLKAGIFYNSIVHNYTFNARTPFQGVGSGRLDYSGTAFAVAGTMNYPAGVADATQWNTFDYGIKSNVYGAEAASQTDNDVYWKLSANQWKTDGTKPMGANPGVYPDIATNVASSQANSALGPFVELPEPVDYTTTNVDGNVGFRGKSYLLTLDGNVSKFSNDIPQLQYRIPTVASKNIYGTFMLPPDNYSWKLGLNGVLHHLPLDSTLATRFSFTKITDDVGLLSSVQTFKKNGANTDYATAEDTPSSPVFHGSKSYGTADIALTSNPVEKLDTKLYYDFARRWDNSTEILYAYRDPFTAVTHPLTGSDPSHAFAFVKHSAGLDVGYRLPFSTRVGAGYQWLRMDRNSEGFNAAAQYPLNVPSALKTTDNTVYVEAKNNAWDLLGAKLKYEHMTRASSFNAQETINLYLTSTSSNILLGYVKPYDVANKRQDTLKASFDSSPIEDLDLTLEGAYKVANYYDTLIGRMKDQSWDVYLGGDYVLPFNIKANVFTDYTLTRTLNGHRKAAGATYNPTTPSFVTSATVYSYAWRDSQIEQTWDYGLGFDVPINEQMTFSLAGQQQRNNGQQTFAQDAVQVGGIPFAPVDHWDDYIRTLITAKFKYRITKHLAASLGYMFDKFDYNDAQLENYAFTPLKPIAPGTTGVGAVVYNVRDFLSGAYSDQNYTAHVGMITAEYSF